MIAVGREEVRRQAADLEQRVGLVVGGVPLQLVDALAADVVGGQLDDGRRFVGRRRPLLRGHLLLALELGVEGVAQAVPEEREADERDRDGDGRERRRGVARERMNFWPSATRLPHDARGGCTPMPMYASVASARIAAGMPSVIATMIGPMPLGSRCLVTIRVSDTPMAFAASTNSVSFSDSS